MNEERCDLTDLPKSMCAHCKGIREPVPRRDERGPWFEASRGGRCGGPCDGRIEAGDRIRSDGEGGWLCSDCGRD